MVSFGNLSEWLFKQSIASLGPTPHCFTKLFMLTVLSAAKKINERIYVAPKQVGEERERKRK